MSTSKGASPDETAKKGKNTVPVSGARLLGLRHAEEQYGISYWTLRHLLGKKLLPVVRLPGVRRLFIDRRDLERLIEDSKNTELLNGKW